MNLLSSDFKTIDEGIAELKQGIKRRDMMCGAMYYNILNDDCAELAGKLVAAGADSKEISAIIGTGMTGL